MTEKAKPEKTESDKDPSGTKSKKKRVVRITVTTEEETTGSKNPRMGYIRRFSCPDGHCWKDALPIPLNSSSPGEKTWHGRAAVAGNPCLLG